MYLSLNWINDYVDISAIEPKELTRRLELATAEIESAQWVWKHFDMVRAALIEKIEDHPNSDKLHLATVFDGEKTSTVVCGAQNIAVGQIVPYAPLGTVLPGDFEIKPAKIRGVESCGMLCSVKELGLGEDHAGILQLEKTIKPGTRLSQIFSGADFVIEIENKTINHRPDLWGHYGFARELRTIFNLPWKKKLERKGIKPDRIEETLHVEMKAEKGLHYIAVKMSGIKVGPSPQWLKNRLETIGLRSINNIVDITNYVMLETAHPLHAFDRKKLAGNTIVVRPAHEGETFVTLDDVERKLLPSDIVIGDTEKGVALGGVMGGKFSEVDEHTTEIVIESALFDPPTIRRTANRLDLRTDAAQRFEKAMWVDNSFIAAERCIELIKELVPGAQITSEAAIADNSAKYGFKGTILIDTEQLRSRLGVTEEKLSDSRITELLTLLEFGVSRNSPQSSYSGVLDVKSLLITVPPHRASKDVSMSADILEEIGRMYGYDNIVPEPPLFPMVPAPKNAVIEKEELVRTLLARTFNGHEIMSSSFLSQRDRDILPEAEERIARLKELPDTPYLRWSLAPNMLKAVATNQKNFDSFMLFEFGRAFNRTGENKRLGVVIAGIEEGFTPLKKLIGALMQELGVPNWRIERAVDTFFNGATLLHPGRGAALTVMKWKAGIFGELHPSIAKAYDLKGRIGYLELDLDRMITLPEKSVKYKAANRFPSTFFDLSVLVPSRVEADKVLDTAAKVLDKALQPEVRATDCYAGNPIPEGFKSLSFRVTLSAPDRTLAGEEMKAAQEKVMAECRAKGWRFQGE